MPDAFEESDSKAGFYYDIKFLAILSYVVFIVLVISSGSIFSDVMKLDSISLVFISFIFFLDLQEFAEVRVPRYGWKSSRSEYRAASILIAMGIPLVLIADYFMSSGVITRLASSLGFYIFFFYISLMAVPIVGLVFYLVFILDFASMHGISLLARDKRILEAYAKHSFFYGKLLRRRKKT